MCFPLHCVFHGPLCMSVSVCVWVPPRVGATARGTLLALRHLPAGLYSTKTGKNREFTFSDKGKCFWLLEEGLYTMFRKTTFLFNSSPLECYWCPWFSLPPKGQVFLLCPPLQKHSFSPFRVLSPSLQARRGALILKRIQFSPSLLQLALLTPRSQPVSGFLVSVPSCPHSWNPLSF